MGREVSIIVPSHNEERFIPGLLASIRRYGPADAEVIVVDGGSVDKTGQLAAAGGAILVRLPRRVFPSSARNAGVSKANGDVFVFLDADVELAEEWQACWSDTLASLRASPMQITGDQYHISKQPSWIERIWFAPLRHRKPAYINGGNLITTRAAFDAIRGFDEKLETGEDVDFCARAQSKGIEVRVDTGLKVFHEGYPKTLIRFIRRERWHGVGDFSALGMLVRSKVALATLAFIGLHAALIGSLIALPLFGHSGKVALATAAGIVLLCLIGCVQKFHGSGFLQVFRAVPVMYIYYVGRSLSLWDVMVSRVFASADGARHR